MGYYKFVFVKVLDPRLSKNVAKNMAKRIAKNKCPMLKLVDATTGDDETVFFGRLALHDCWALNPVGPIDLFSVRHEAINKASYAVEKYIDSAKNPERKDVVYHAFISIDDKGEKFVRIAEITFYTQVYGSPADDAFRKTLHEIRHDSSCMALERIAEYKAHVAKHTATLAEDIVKYIARVTISLIVAPFVSLIFGIGFLVNEITTFRKEENK